MYFAVCRVDTESPANNLKVAFFPGLDQLFLVYGTLEKFKEHLQDWNLRDNGFPLLLGDCLLWKQEQPVVVSLERRVVTELQQTEYTGPVAREKPRT